MSRKTDSQQTTNAIIAQKMETLQSTMSEGFRIMHEKQDMTNGKVLRAKEDIAGLQTEDLKIRAEFKYNRIIWYMLTVAVSTIIALVSYILFNH
jgi:hypothetical protein